MPLRWSPFCRIGPESAAVFYMRTRLLGILAASVLLAQTPRKTATPKVATPKAVTANIPNTDDIQSLVRRLGAPGSGMKDEFETTTQFQARQKALQSDRKYAFALEADAYGPSGDDKCDCEYD